MNNNDWFNPNTHIWQGPYQIMPQGKPVEALTEEAIRKIVREELAAQVKVSKEDAQKEKVVPLERTPEGVLRVAPAKKQIDWSKMPVDCVVKTKYGLNFFVNVDSKGRITTNSSPDAVKDGMYNYSCSVEDISLADEKHQSWMVWQPTGSSECPVSEGVVVKVILRDGEEDCDEGVNYYWCFSNARDGDIIAYKIVGLAEGYER